MPFPTIGADSDSCVIIRPNLNRKTGKKYDIREKLMNGVLASVTVDKAMKIWKKEFSLADISSDETYQFSCPGRHKEVRKLTTPLYL